MLVQGIGLDEPKYSSVHHQPHDVIRIVRIRIVSVSIPTSVSILKRKNSKCIVTVGRYGMYKAYRQSDLVCLSKGCIDILQLSILEQRGGDTRYPCLLPDELPFRRLLAPFNRKSRSKCGSCALTTCPLIYQDRTGGYRVLVFLLRLDGRIALPCRCAFGEVDANQNLACFPQLYHVDHVFGKTDGEGEDSHDCRPCKGK